MIYPDKHKFHYNLLSWYVNRILRKDFEKVEVFGKPVQTKQSTLVLANHSSWWDGFWMMYANNKHIKKNFYVLMLEEELAKRNFFRKVGAYSINPEKGQIKDSLQFTRTLLAETNNMVLYFPEGEFRPATQQPKKFNRGVSFLYRQPTNFTTTFVVFLSDYFKYRKPILSIYLQEYNFPGEITASDLETEYNRFFGLCVERQKKLAK